MTDLLEAMMQDAEIELSELRVDGGASVSNIMLQIQANMIRTKVDRPKTVETTALGAAYLAGLAVGYWKSLDDIRDNWAIDRVFTPAMDEAKRHELLHGWHKAVRCALTWADEDEDL
jgi:glycerol kinase